MDNFRDFLEQVMGGRRDPNPIPDRPGVGVGGNLARPGADPALILAMLEERLGRPIGQGNPLANFARQQTVRSSPTRFEPPPTGNPNPLANFARQQTTRSSPTRFDPYPSGSPSSPMRRRGR